MQRRKVTMAAAAIFAIGAAFAAEPTSLRADWGEAAMARPPPWGPGTGGVMSAREPGLPIVAPPR